MADPTPVREQIAGLREALEPILRDVISRTSSGTDSFSERATARREATEDAIAAILAGPFAQAEEKIARLTKERNEARGALERDRSTVIMQVGKIKDAVSGRAWLLEGGRGPYAWDDDRFRAEFSDALHAIEAPVEELRRIGADWSNCPTDPEAIRAARVDLKAERDAATARAEAASDRAEALQEALWRVQQWSEAYPTDVFPEPDWKRARDLLEAGGMTLDRVSAGCMRRVVEGVGKIARAALSDRSPETPGLGQGGGA